MGDFSCYMQINNPSKFQINWINFRRDILRARARRACVRAQSSDAENGDFWNFFWKFVFWPQMLPNRLVWPWIDVKSQKIDLLGDILP